MKAAILLFVICNLIICNLQFAQTYSDINYNSGTLITVDAGADICADDIIINGTYSGAGTICQGALPVSISSFTHSVNKRDVTLSWVTEWEQNNSGFRIERKQPDETVWKEISFVKGGGITNETKSYSFTDKKLNAGKYKYRLKQIDYNGSYEYFSLMNEVIISPPGDFAISQNYPNPGNPKSKIDFEIPVEGKVTVKVYNMLGQEVITLINDTRKAGYYTIDFDGTNIASGVYFYRIFAQGEGQKFIKTLKMILIK